MDGTAQSFQDAIEKRADDSEHGYKTMKTLLENANANFPGMNGINLSNAFIIAITKGNSVPLSALCDFVYKHKVIVDYDAVLKGCREAGKPILTLDPAEIEERSESSTGLFLDLLVKINADYLTPRGRHRQRPSGPDTGQGR